MNRLSLFTIAIAFVAFACNKEQSENSKILAKKSLPTESEEVDSLVAEFATDLRAVAAESMSSSEINDLEEEYANWLMEATFNYFHAVSDETIAALEDDATLERLSHTIEIDLSVVEGISYMDGASLADEFIHANSYLDGLLGTDEFYLVTDFDIEEYGSSSVFVNITAVKALAASAVPTGPIGPNEAWYAYDDSPLGNSGTCSGGYTGTDATDRYVPVVFQNNRPWPIYEMPRYPYSFNVNTSDLGITTYIGPETSTLYCGQPWKKSPYVSVPSNCNISYGAYNDCLSASILQAIVGGLDDFIQDEKPSGKTFLACTGSSINGGSSSQLELFHTFEATYGQQNIPLEEPEPLF